MAHRLLAGWVAEGKTAGEWTDDTTRRVAQGLLSTLRDFGVLDGAVHKRIAPAYFPVTAFAYVTFYLKQHQPSGAKLVEHPDWKLFFLCREKWSSASCSRPISRACWNTTPRAASPG